ncbi:uncharacterized protein [Littorina saxatilis]|uniref:Uncharacterized protein n=1 Tax=Littorina saxatilis TaxID=31220 RepID=A0AAN9AUV8_9CAEN
MLAAVFCVLSLFSCVSAAALRPLRDGFSLENIDGERHFGYGTVPGSVGGMIRVEFYDVDFASNNCSDLRVDIYNNGYLKTDQDLVETICDPLALADFTRASSRGFFIAMQSSINTQRGQIKARFLSNGPLKVTHEILHR